MRLKWEKKGLVFKTKAIQSWAQTHAQVPIVDTVDDKMWRIYYASRDDRGRSHTSFIEVEAGRPENILYIHNKPILELGQPGCFDDSGIMPTSILSLGEKKYLYYIGWMRRGSVPFQNAIGLAVSHDNGRTYQRVFAGPIIGQSAKEPFFTGTCCVIKRDENFVAYYLSCVGWEKQNEYFEPLYNIKIARSKNAIDWELNSEIALDLQSEEGGLASASVLNNGNKMSMWYSVRGKSDYRNNSKQAYRIEYAESSDGLNWVRDANNRVLHTSKDAWDTNMLAYPNVIKYKGKLFMFYNGNGFGQSGFGYATANL
ncbi:hypothetical protein [Glaciecola petra]|uniref:Glycosyl hydrolase family 32 N-terminal domain-containing protein n=1 Tax=Glaciecola petra TaxID=3075602 RepID=A0ABU2ZN74_9ALTE|nr:hypothetical protein [Aestuariibacter sp. P117]MDT0593855.1 hypothetical protein [Aestuariibacter sp. P117]